jgi:hypothetical protein
MVMLAGSYDYPFPTDITLVFSTLMRMKKPPTVQLAFHNNGLMIDLNFGYWLMTLKNEFNGLIQSTHKKINLVQLP